VGDRQAVQSSGEVAAVRSRRGERRQQPIERTILAEKEQFVLAAEVVVQVAERQVGGGGNLAHAGRGETALTKDAGRRAQDLHAARIGASTDAWSGGRLRPGRLHGAFRLAPARGYRTVVR